ncbi:MAG TPA: hypothetical protein VLH39_07280 [Magnetospirillaceae bacterium]|nr:hypothetical protein [Magnetospirillaceae bacterium]
MRIKIALLSGALFLVALGALGGVLLAVRAGSRQLVQREFLSYIESLSETGKLVLVEGRERLTVRETARGQLFGNTTVGDLLGIRSDATVELSAWAELSWAVDLQDTALWSVRLNRRERSLHISAPPLMTLTPALRTETIEARVLDRSIFLNEKHMIDTVRRALTARFEEIARSTSEQPEIRARAASSLSAIALAFSRRFGLAADSAEVVFGLEE